LVESLHIRKPEHDWLSDWIEYEQFDMILPGIKVEAASCFYEQKRDNLEIWEL